MKHESTQSERHSALAGPKPVRVGKFLFLFVVVAVAVGVMGVFKRKQADEELGNWTREQALPTVAVTTVKPDTSVKHVVLPGDIDAFYSAAIHSQVTGYVHEWRKDIGAKVVKGEVLATIDTPALDDQLVQAEGEVDKANANLSLAETTAERWRALGKSAAVSQQAIDEKVGDQRAKEAELEGVKANLARLRSQKDFAAIMAPFDGVITARNFDIGSYVSSSADSGLPMFVVADVSRMRVYVKAPQVYAAEMKNSMTAQLRLPEYPGRVFEATVDTTSSAIDGKSRSLLVELLVSNKDGLLRPGSFAQVAFEIPGRADALELSSSALLFRDQKALVAIIGPDDGVKLKRIHITRDYGSSVETDGGLSLGERIALSPPESISDGDKVRVAGADVSAAATQMVK